MIELWYADDDDELHMLKASKIVELYRDFSDYTIFVGHVNPRGEYHGIWIGGKLGGYIVYRGVKFTCDYIWEDFKYFEKLIAVINHNSEIEDAMEKL